MNKYTNYVLSTRHPLYDWTEAEIEEKVNEFKNDIEGSKFKIIIALCIYNEEDFLEECLENCLLINDLDAIHILDGAWEDGGKYGYSTDATTNIINNFKQENPRLSVIYESNVELWKNQGSKRNHQLMRIEELWGDAYVIVKDGDEVFSFPNGKTSIWLKPLLKNFYPALGIMKSYAYGSDISMDGARLIPTQTGIHYHTAKSMIIHDNECNVICDYNVDVQKRTLGKTYQFDKMIYVNHWNMRNRERLKTKVAYSEKYVFNDKEIGECSH